MAEKWMIRLVFLVLLLFFWSPLSHLTFPPLLVTSLRLATSPLATAPLGPANRWL